MFFFSVKHNCTELITACPYPEQGTVIVIFTSQRHWVLKFNKESHSDFFCCMRPNKCVSSFVAQELSACFSNEAVVLSDGCSSTNPFEER